MPGEEMTQKEIEQFLACARVGRLGMCLESGPYVVPVGYAYADGKIFFHTCNKGLKMDAIRRIRMFVLRLMKPCQMLQCLRV